MNFVEMQREQKIKTKNNNNNWFEKRVKIVVLCSSIFKSFQDSL